MASNIRHGRSAIDDLSSPAKLTPARARYPHVLDRQLNPAPQSMPVRCKYRRMTRARGRSARSMTLRLGFVQRQQLALIHVTDRVGDGDSIAFSLHDNAGQGLGDVAATDDAGSSLYAPIQSFRTGGARDIEIRKVDRHARRFVDSIASGCGRDTDAEAQ